MTKHHMHISILKRPYDKPVHFKSDGERFGEEKTLKLNVNASYAFNISVKPPLAVTDVCLFGNRVEFDELRGDEGVVYRAQATTTNLLKNAKTERQQLPISVQLENSSEIALSLQCKLYAEHENQHCCWGSPLAFIDVVIEREAVEECLKLIDVVYR